MLDQLAEFKTPTRTKRYVEVTKAIFWLILSLVATFLNYRVGYYELAMLMAFIAGGKVQEVFREIDYLFWD